MRCNVCRPRSEWIRWIFWFLLGICALICVTLVAVSVHYTFWIFFAAAVILWLAVKGIRWRSEQICIGQGCPCQTCDHFPPCCCGCEECCGRDYAEEETAEDPSAAPSWTVCEECRWVHELNPELPPNSGIDACSCICHD